MPRTSAEDIPNPIRSQSKLKDIVSRWSGASRALQRFDLDYCCSGDETVAEACLRRRIPVAEVISALRAETTPSPAGERWEDQSVAQLLTHILTVYHEGHRAELPALIEMADKVEAVHGERPECPRGLTAHLRQMAEEMESHMQKEEQCLFPALLAGRFDVAGPPIAVMLAEHEEHGKNLARLRALTHGFVPPADACNTWRALYLRLEELERAVMEHVHLENHVLFPRATRGQGPSSNEGR